MVQMQAFESVSTWRQPEPVPLSPVRSRLVQAIATQIAGLSAARQRVAIDGYTAAGKTSFGHELATALRSFGRPTLRASLDDFKYPWSHAREHGYDRLTAEGYYRNPWDFSSIRRLLLEPAGAFGSGVVTLCGHDPLTGEDWRDATIEAPADAVLVADGVFAFRPELNDQWDFRIWLDIDPEESLRRGVARDSASEGPTQALRVHRDRYHGAEQIYLAEVAPRAHADIVIDNSDLARPRVVEAR